MSNPFSAASAAAAASFAAAPAAASAPAPAPAPVQGTEVTAATAEIAAQAGMTVETPESGEGASVDASPEVQTETAEAAPEGEQAPAAEAPSVEAMRPGVRAAQEFRRQFIEARETAAAERAKRELLESTLAPILQQFAELQRAQQVQAQPPPPPEPEFDDMGDPALRQIYELQKKLEAQEKWRESIEKERHYQSEVSRWEGEYRQQFTQLQAQHPVLQSKEAGRAFWDKAQQFPEAPLALIAQLIAAEHGSRQPNGDSRPGQVPARPVSAQPAPNVPPKPAPPRPPPGGMAAAVPVAQRPMTFESATEAARLAFSQGRI